MGGCMSAPTDNNYADTEVIEQEDGSDEASLIYNGNMVMGSKITLSFECKDLKRTDLLSKSDPFIVVYLKDDKGKWVEIGRTEIVVNSQSPTFVKKILMTYKFEEIQKLKFKVYDADTEDLSKQDKLGSCTSELPCLVHSSSAVTLPLKHHDKQKGSLIIKCEELHQSSGDLITTIVGKNISSNCFIRILSDNEKNGCVPVYKTECSKTGTWKPIAIDISILCNCDYNRPLIFEVFKHKQNGNHIKLGQMKTSVNSLLQSVEQTIILSDCNENISLYIQECRFVEKASFLQFIQNGLDINFMVAIDFTGSNGSPTNPSSLHYANPNAYAQGNYNQYEKAIAMIGSVIEFYDTDRMFPVYGFGACLGNDYTANHCFALNLNEANPEVPGVNGIMNIYHSMLTQVHFSGPTLFNPILSKAATIAQNIQQQRNKYLILLILTDGAIHDMEDTISTIVNASDLPLSILIVGVGNADFDAMEALDSDKQKLRSHNKVAKRDIVQFVAMRDVISEPPEEIAKQLLAEVPGQVTSYMKDHHITPSTLH